jgi:hypothetical protein
MGAHRWKFYRAGGFDQVALLDGNDIVHLPELDPKLWVALAMPVKGVELDRRTLELLDADKDGRVRVPEVLAAARFVAATFEDPGELVKSRDAVALASLKDAKLKDAAGRVLAALGKPGAKEITLGDLDAHHQIVDQQTLNGDGVLPPSSTDDAESRKVIQEILDTVGGVADKGGQQGVGKAQVTQFFADARALVAWQAKADTDKSIFVAGAGTEAAVEAVKAIRGKVDDYFTRCRLAALDPRAAEALNGATADFVALAAKQLSGADADVARLPLARIEPGKPLPLKDGLNPAWVAPVATFAAATHALQKGVPTALTESDWRELVARLAPAEAYLAAKPTTPVEKLGGDRLRAILAGTTEKALAELIAADEAQAAKNAEVLEVERAVRYRRDLFEVLQNFVSFSRFYSRKGAAFQAGTLYLDGRACNLCLDVTDPAKHAALAAMSGSYLAYCDLRRPGGETRQIVAAFTGGDGDNLFVGRNGMFYDRQGKDWDATITKLMPNPISVREGFWAPYKKLAALIEEQAAKRGAAAGTDSDAILGKTATAVAHADKVPEPPQPKKIDIGTVAAIGVAVGGVGAMVVGVLSAFVGMGAWMPLGLLGLVLVISGPSMFLAWLKLRKRNLGPLLDANGWAINSRARINVPFGGALTDLATLPRGAERSLDDPFAEKRVPWALYVTLAFIATLGASWYSGKLDAILPRAIKKRTVLPAEAPAPPPAPPAAAAPAK